MNAAYVALEQDKRKIERENQQRERASPAPYYVPYSYLRSSFLRTVYMTLCRRSGLECLQLALEAFLLAKINGINFVSGVLMLVDQICQFFSLQDINEIFRKNGNDLCYFELLCDLFGELQITMKMEKSDIIDNKTFASIMNFFHQHMQQTPWYNLPFSLYSFERVLSVQQDSNYKMKFVDVKNSEESRSYHESCIEKAVRAKMPFTLTEIPSKSILGIIQCVSFF
eukprot:TRINITY_DN3641_c1_g1_i1.p1 TRINITY_DN3641_c1_g1~~TRINITY_DN3641_c1_g1_i1.p1  ORF type:complete len:226 (-),score=9.06 TRINITY_DN3641_c1_g1_i1:482-1159(-)